MESYPFLDFINEDKSQYKHAKDCGYIDDDDLFLIGDSGGFLMNINPGDKFVNTELFTEMADFYRKNKLYTTFKEDSILHRQIRKREQRRRRDGFTAPCLRKANGTIVDVRITGEHYNFLNYVQIEKLDTRSVKHGNKTTGKKTHDFPEFFDAQFWFFHIREFAKKNGFNLLIDKTRRGGFSYIMASCSANTVNNFHHKVVIHVAADNKYLTMTGGLTSFTINNLKHYEENTPFKRGILKTVNTDFHLGYKLPNGIEATNSWASALLSVSAFNNPDCAIGKDAIEVDVEEVSTMDNFDKFMTVTAPTMKTGSVVTGMLCAWGTATSGNMQEFEQNFYNPKAHNFMPFENVWDKDSRSQVCGYFKPYCWALQGDINGIPGVDKDGNSNILVGLEISRRERIDKKENSKTYAEYINYLGQYANFPGESFSSSSENIFSSEELSAWEDRLRIDEDLHFYTDGMLEDDLTGGVIFKSNDRLSKEGKKVYDWIFGVPRRGNEDPHGCIRIWFFPEYDRNSPNKREIKKGTYSISYDPVGVDKLKTEITNKHSHNSIKVWMNPNVSNGFKQKLVAAYYGRPDTLEESDRICYMLAVYYNCIESTNVETNRGETISNFKKWKATKYLGYEPTFIWDDSLKGKINTTFGYNINNSNKLDAIRLFKEFLYEEIGKDENGKPIRNFHRIYDYQSILEIKKWNNIGNFDRVSEMLIRGIEWKGIKVLNEGALSSKQELSEDKSDSQDILSREWY